VAVVETAVVPRARQATRAATFACPAAEAWPQIDFSPLAAAQELHFTTDAMSTVFAARPDGGSVRFAKAYVFDIPRSQTQTVRASEITAVLGTHFATGGYLSMML
jgi:hypothetical protein